MNRVPSLAFRVAVAAFVLCSAGVSRMHAQAPAHRLRRRQDHRPQPRRRAAETAEAAEDENPLRREARPAAARRA